MQNRKRDTDVQNRLLDSVGVGKGVMFRENSIETCILSRVKQITSPGWMYQTSAQGWCTGKTQRDWVEREVGGGTGWGIHVNPWLIHVSVWQKPLQYCKVISFQLIKINGKNKNKKAHVLVLIKFNLSFFFIYDNCFFILKKSAKSQLQICIPVISSETQMSSTTATSHRQIF